MSLLRNSVIVGGATFLVGSAFMEIGKADSKSDIGKWPYIATFLSGALGFYLLKQNFIPVPKALELNADYYDNYGDMEYIILEMLTDEQLEAEYGDYMREHQNGPLSRDDLPTALDNDYRTDEEAPYLRKKYFDEEYHAEYDFKNHAITTVVADDEDEAWDKFSGMDEAWQAWEIIDVREAESALGLQAFASEVFMADRKIRRRTRWTWTRGQESGFEVENDDISELPYDIDYSGQKGRGWKSQYVPLYSIEDSYHISDLPEGYHLHLYKPSVRSGQWRAFSKSPTSEDWNEYRNNKKSNLTGELLTWYNQDIAQPEEKTLSPIEKLMISKGLKSGTIQIERVVIPSTNYTNEKVQYFALGGPRNMSPTKFCEIEGGVISLENLTSNESNLFAFGQGLKFMTEKAGTLRSVNRFNKNPEAWVKSYPAWFQNAVKNKLTDINVKFTDENEYDGGMRINGFRVLKFLNGASRYSWQGINESKRKVIDTPYGEMPQFEIYELDMNDPAPIIPRPSTMRKIYAKSFKQNLSGDWKFDEEMFMMAVVDKYKFENGGSEKIHNSMVDEPLYSIDIIPYMTPMAELMARRYKKKE